jgi:2-dehydro-3-deoxygalactonokinase
MAGDGAYIAGDWGTTNARFWLCDAQGAVLSESIGKGVSALRADRSFAGAFAEATRNWPETIPAVICGTIGANIGWHEVGYRAMPARVDSPDNAALRFSEGSREIAILAGVSGLNSFGQIDLMRGEECQLAGLALAGTGDGLFVLPGTHNKWVVLKDGLIASFHTAMTGELFAAISGHTILLSDPAARPASGEAFDRGVNVALDHGAAGLASLLFTTRARQVRGLMAPAEAASYLSGVMIGSDVASGIALCRASLGNSPVTVVGGESLAAGYARALELAGVESTNVSGDEAVRQGLHLAWQRLFG